MVDGVQLHVPIDQSPEGCADAEGYAVRPLPDGRSLAVAYSTREVVDDDIEPITLLNTIKMTTRAEVEALNGGPIG